MGGVDVLGKGTWLAMNDASVVAGVLNRVNTLGPAPGFRSRGDIPLRALEHHTAAEARDALCDIDAGAYRPFNAFVIDRNEGFWLRSSHEAGATTPKAHIEAFPLKFGVSMITAYDCDDPNSPRINRYLPLFKRAATPNPETNDWQSWIDLLRCRKYDPGGKPGGAMTVVTETGFGTVCSSLIALPSEAANSAEPIWLFAAGRPDITEFETVAR